jgi:hypothetical protein
VSIEISLQTFDTNPWVTVGKCVYVNGRTGKEGLEKSVGQGARVCIYHLLGAAFSQGVAITQVIDLDILDEVTVLLVDIDIEGTTIAGGGGLSTAGSDTWRVCLRKELSADFLEDCLLTRTGEGRAILHELAGRRHAAGPFSGSAAH